MSYFGLAPVGTQYQATPQYTIDPNPPAPPPPQAAYIPSPYQAAPVHSQQTYTYIAPQAVPPPPPPAPATGASVYDTVYDTSGGAYLATNQGTSSYYQAQPTGVAQQGVVKPYYQSTQSSTNYYGSSRPGGTYASYSSTSAPAHSNYSTYSSGTGGSSYSTGIGSGSSYSTGGTGSSSYSSGGGTGASSYSSNRQTSSYSSSSYTSSGGSSSAAPKSYQSSSTSSSKPSSSYSATSTNKTTVSSSAPVTQAVASGPTVVTVTVSNTQGYDQALYTAAAAYNEKQAAVNKLALIQTGPSASESLAAATSSTKRYYNPFKKGGTGSYGNANRSGGGQLQQVHYCDVCKISCAGYNTYKEHLAGTKHRKKETEKKAEEAAAAAKLEADASGGTVTTSARKPFPIKGKAGIKCPLCDVTCTGTDAFAMHTRGKAHMKTLALHRRLGKHIPVIEPVLVTSKGDEKTLTQLKAEGNEGAAVKLQAQAAAASKALQAPRINFVGGSELHTTASGLKEIKVSASKIHPKLEDDDKPVDPIKKALGEQEAAPVGEEYIEEIRNALGKLIQYQCKLCQCSFTDINARNLHAKGRRHRFSYKKKVDPSLKIEVKLTPQERRRDEIQKARLKKMKEMNDRREMAMRIMREQRAYEATLCQEQLNIMQTRGGTVEDLGGLRKADTLEDKYLLAKHSYVYPTDIELQRVQRMVTYAEKTLKLVSDDLSEVDTEAKKAEICALKARKKEVRAAVKVDTEVKKEEGAEEEAKEEEEESSDEEDIDDIRAVKGIMRVGKLAKGLLLTGDLNIQLVLLCSVKPTKALLNRVYESFAKHIATVCKDKLVVSMSAQECCISIKTSKEPIVYCAIQLTSPLVREANLSQGEFVIPDPPDMLSKQKCLDALASLRHAKWFQSRVSNSNSCIVALRIMIDLCNRVPTWSALPTWALELLVEKAITSSGTTLLTPAEAVRRILEAIASGIIMPGSNGLLDPCEKIKTDALASLSVQQREDITASAQHAMRLMAFGQMYKVLGMDKLPVPHLTQKRKLPKTNTPIFKKKKVTTEDGTEVEEKIAIINNDGDNIDVEDIDPPKPVVPPSVPGALGATAAVKMEAEPQPVPGPGEKLVIVQGPTGTPIVTTVPVQPVETSTTTTAGSTSDTTTTSNAAAVSVTSKTAATTAAAPAADSKAAALTAVSAAAAATASTRSTSQVSPSASGSSSSKSRSSSGSGGTSSSSHRSSSSSRDRASGGYSSSSRANSGYHHSSSSGGYTGGYGGGGGSSSSGKRDDYRSSSSRSSSGSNYSSSSRRYY